MKLRIAIIAVTVFVAAGGAGLYFYLRQVPVETLVYAALEGRSPEEADIELTPELRVFVDWYKPMVLDAPLEVVDIMKRFDPKYRSRSTYRNRELEEVVPADEWIKRHLDMGVEIEDYDDYSDYLEDRWSIYHAAKDPEKLQDLKDRHDLDADALFDEVIEADIRENVLFKQLLDQAMANDSKIYGGSFSKEGVFIPIRLNTVYVQPGTIRKGRGVPKWVVHEIRERELGNPPSREFSKDVDIIYLDENGQPIQDRLPPSSGDGAKSPAFLRNETNTVFGPAREDSPPADDFDNSFADDFEGKSSEIESFEFEKPNLPKSMAELEKQLTPEGIEAELSEGLSPERRDKVQQLIDQCGTGEGLRRLRKSDPDAARQFERERREPPVRSESGEASSTR